MWKPALGTSLAVIASWVSTSASGAEQEETRLQQHPPTALWVRLFDDNHDGKLDADEIEKAAERLKERDNNGNGELDAAELMLEGRGVERGRSSQPNHRVGPPGPPHHWDTKLAPRGRDEMGPPHRGFGPPWVRPEMDRPYFGPHGPGEFRGHGEPHAFRGPIGPGPAEPGIGPRRGAGSGFPSSHPGPSRFEEMDVNHDGSIDRQEFLAARPPHSRAHLSEAREENSQTRERGSSEREAWLDRASRRRGSLGKEQGNAAAAENPQPSATDGENEPG